jgi:hypothetical protein
MDHMEIHLRPEVQPGRLKSLAGGPADNKLAHTLVNNESLATQKNNIAIS